MMAMPKVFKPGDWLRSAVEIPHEIIEIDEGYLDFVINKQVKDLGEAVADKISDGNMYIVKMDEIKEEPSLNKNSTTIYRGVRIAPLVTCGECKWCDNKGKGRALICTNPYIDMDIHPLDFCSYAERRDE